MRAWVKTTLLAAFFVGSIHAQVDADPQNFLVDFHAHNAVGTLGNDLFTQKLTVSSQSAVPCGGGIFLTHGMSEPPDVTILTNGSPMGNQIPFTLPPGASRTFEFTAPTGFDTFGIWVEANVPCAPSLSSVSQFHITGSSNEVFFSPSARIPNGGCGEFPFNFGPDGTNTGVATIGNPFFEPLAPAAGRSFTLLDSTGDVIEGPITGPYSGHQGASLGSQIFDLDGMTITDGTMRVCLFDGFQDQYLNVTAIGVNPTPAGVQLSGAPVTLTGPCIPDTTTVCLQDNRFKVEIDWDSGTASGSATGLKKDDAGYFYFLNLNNTEVIVKVLNACSVDNRYWVFASGLTDVEFTISVTDTTNNQTETYFNPQGTLFAPVTDTDAFATCP